MEKLVSVVCSFSVEPDAVIKKNLKFAVKCPISICQWSYMEVQRRVSCGFFELSEWVLLEAI